MLLRARGRAVTADDFVQLARDVAPEAARVHCAASREGDEGEGVLVLVVPNVAGDHVGRIRRDDLVPDEGMLQRIAEALDELPAGGDPGSGRTAALLGADRGGRRARPGALRRRRRCTTTCCARCTGSSTR